MMQTTSPFKKGLYWYCVRSKPKKERMAAQAIEQLHGIEVFCPQVRFQRKTVRGAVWFQEAMFPGYFFARFDLSESKQIVSYAPGVLTIPSFNERFIPLPDSLIKELKEEMMQEEEVIDLRAPLEAGEETVVLNGSMRGLKVKVLRLMPAKQRVAVLMDMMGTLVEAEFPLNDLEHRKKHPLAVTG